MKLSQEQIDGLWRMPVDRPNRLAIAFCHDGHEAVGGVRRWGSCRAVSQLVRGDYKSVSVERARQFADLFGCQIEDLFPAREGVA